MYTMIVIPVIPCMVANNTGKELKTVLDLLSLLVMVKSKSIEETKNRPPGREPACEIVHDSSKKLKHCLDNGIKPLGEQRQSKIFLLKGPSKKVTADLFKVSKQDIRTVEQAHLLYGDSTWTIVQRLRWGRRNSNSHTMPLWSRHKYHPFFKQIESKRIKKSPEKENPDFLKDTRLFWKHHAN